MKSWFILLPILMFLFLSPAAVSFDMTWTEKKLGKVIVKADKAARQKKWSRAIKYGDQALEGSAALDKIEDPRYISQLKNINRYYDKAGRLLDVAHRIRQAYLLSSKHLGKFHETTKASRNLYYKLLVTQKDFLKAIPLILESVSNLKADREADFKRLRYLKQLYSLYALTRQYDKEETALMQYLTLSKKLLGEDDESIREGVINLARNYCRQKKLPEFTELSEKYSLKYVCE